MAAAWVFLRAELRRRWRAWLSVALLAGAFAGVVTAAAAGARRTDSAYPRLLAWSKAPDIVIVSGYSADFAPLPRAALARLPQVTAMGYVQGIDLVAPTDITLLAPEDNRIPGGFWKRKIVAGRLADPRRPNEVNVSFTLAQARHLKVGDPLPVVLKTARGEPVRFVFRVVGVEAAASEFPPQTDAGSGDVWTTPAFWRTHRANLQTFPEAALRLLSGFLGVIGVLALGQVLVRLSFVESSDCAALRALGMSRRQLMAVGVGRAAAIGTAAGGVAVALAFALSPLLPVGLAGLAEPHPGLDADGLVLATGGLATILVTVAGASPSAWRMAATGHAPDAVSVVRGRAGPLASLIGGSRSAARMMGVRLALHPGAGPTALPVRSTIGGAVVGVAALSAALVFSASLSHLLATPRLYGVAWDALVSSSNGAELTPVARIVARDPHVAAWSAGYSDGLLQVNGAAVGVIVMGQGHGPSLTGVPVQGRLPRARDEITLGPQTLASMRTRVGAIAQVSMPGQRPVRFRIVGTAIFPTLSDALGLGQGAALTLAGLRRLPGVPAAPLDALLVRFGSGTDPQAATGTLTSQAARAGPFIVQGPATPTDLVNFGRVRSLPMLLGIALSGLALATIAHLLMTSVRRRRRDFAILRTLGFTRGQIRRTAAWQAATLTAAALAIGIPAGLVCGRVAWQIFARHLGILPVVDIPLLQFAVVITTALALAVAVAVVPGESAVRAHPTHVLRSE